jgi:hypothetical protein
VLTGVWGVSKFISEKFGNWADGREFFTIPHTHTIHKMINQFRYSVASDLEEFQQPRVKFKTHSTCKV